MRAAKERAARGERGKFERRDDDRSRGQRDDRRSFSRAPRREGDDFRGNRDFKRRDDRFEGRGDRNRGDRDRGDRGERRGGYDKRGGFDRKPRQEGGFSRPNRGGNLRKRRED